MGTGVFENSVKNYKMKFDSILNNISATGVEVVGKSYGVSLETMKEGLKSNTSDFQKFCHAYASSLIPGRVSGCTYAAVVAWVAKQLGVPYKVYAGFCVQKSSPRYERDISDWKAKRESGVEHPFFATHAYTEINGVDFEYFNGATSDVDHLDVVVIAEG